MALSATQILALALDPSNDLRLGPSLTGILNAIFDTGTNSLRIKIRGYTLDATVDPTVDEDDTAGFPIGSIYINVSNDTSFISVDSTDGAAVWKQISNGVGAPTTVIADYNAATNTPDLDTTPIATTQGDRYVVTAAGLFFTRQVQVNDVLLSRINNATTLANWAIIEGDAGVFEGSIISSGNGTIASAATTDIGPETEKRLNVTGTATITSFGTADVGTERTLIFSGILTLTHNGTSLKLPTGANITTAAEDVLTIISLGSGNWRVTNYQRKDGTALVGDGGGDVTGPGTSTTDNISTFADGTGKVIKDSGIAVADVTANTAKVTNATHTGDVTGATALTIADNAVTLAKMADMATASILGRNTAATGDPEVLSAATARSVLNVEDGSTADQSDAEIKTAYENNANTNEFSDAEQTKLAGIETGATADQTGAEIKTAYEVEANAYTDTKNTKLAGIETAATADQTDAEIETAYNNQVAIVPQAEAEAGTATTRRGWTAERVKQAIAALETGGTGDVVGPASAVNENIAVYDGVTGKIIKDGLISKADVVANNAKVTNATHTGDVTGATALTIADNAVTLAKMADMATASILGRNTAATGDPEVLSAATARSVLNVEDGSTADQSDAEIKTAYENNANTNAFTDAEQTKLGGIEALAEVNDVDSVNGQAGVVVLDEDNVNSGNGTIASADTMDIGAEQENRLEVSGTTTITSFGTVAAGIERTLVFLGNLVLTHNAVKILLPTAANIVVSSGDVIKCISKGGGLWRVTSYERVNGTPLAEREAIGIFISDETTDLTTGTAKRTFRMPFAMTLNAGKAGVSANVNTASAGSTIIVDVNAGGSTILSTKLSIDASEKTSQTAAVEAVISDLTLEFDQEITIDIDQVGTTTKGKGLKIWLIGTRTIL